MNDRHVALISAFYDALGRADFAAMESCYHPDVSFGDPIFLEVEGRERVMRMWRLQLGVRDGLRSTYGDVTADDHTGSAHWTARYTFARTGREVGNEIDALFRFEEGLIVRHHDEFDFRRWSKMALGKPHGLLFGWTPMWRKSIRDRAAQQLDEFRPA
ncbi:nuclear transport factor 2 family protein [Nonomuraea sp. KC401]|uniref:nuclear transport factor 2 family protein n=1 Tax=unclassified Nonomuraea TaxID=2593643 RepID=UPI0010FE142F|nr:nuclear transport factor 2 family protein [Nonomuraea sp. KC401]NBE99159.1 nuclear transport factor 2 family protein [Nonomuraea sp. K271]TLF57715.1 nuclear transport factor 2 family protein [Nonomuraea sp. KC401]